jgi:hypothetical protein
MKLSYITDITELKRIYNELRRFNKLPYCIDYMCVWVKSVYHHRRLGYTDKVEKELKKILEREEKTL